MQPKLKGYASDMKAIQDFSGFFDETTLVICGDSIVDLGIGAPQIEYHNKRVMARMIVLEVPKGQVQKLWNFGRR